MLYIIIELLIKRRTIPAETGNGTLEPKFTFVALVRLLPGIDALSFVVDVDDTSGLAGLRLELALVAVRLAIGAAGGRVDGRAESWAAEAGCNWGVKKSILDLASKVWHLLICRHILSDPI